MKTLKSILLSSLALVLLNGCMTDQSENTTNDTITEETITPSDSAQIIENPLQPLPYVVNYDDATGRLEIEENPVADTTSLNSDQLVLALKNKYPEINLRIGDRKQDTLDIHIDDATYLTQSIGSAGAEAFLIEATYGFTAIDSIKVVNFVFKPGDHAMPGPYDRKYFKDFH